MGASMHTAWTWVRAEIGVGILSLLLLIVPLYFARRRRRQRKHGWNTFAEEFDASADGVFTEKAKYPVALEWAFWPLLLLGIGGLWVGIPRMQALKCVERGNEVSFGSGIPKAIVWYRKALHYNPDCALAHHGLATIFLDQGKRDEALHEFEAALRSDPDNAVFHRDLAVLWLEYGNSEQALLEYYRAAALDPQASEIHAEFARMLVTDGKLEEAIQQYRIALRYSHETASLHYDLANALLMQGKSDAALEQYSVFIETNPNDAHAYNNYGVLLYGAKRFSEAVLAFRKATKLDNQYAEAYFNLGRATAKLGQTDQAIRAYTAFLPLGVKSPDYTASLIEARKQLRKLKSQPQSP